MKNKLLLAGVALSILLIASNFSFMHFSENSEKGIQFHQGTWKEALELARKENKLIFLDVYATWCRPCKLLKTRTFSDEEVGAFYNLNFINVTIDGEKGKGVELAKKFGVRAYPTLLFISPDGKLVGGAEGYHRPNQFISLGKKVLKQ